MPHVLAIPSLAPAGLVALAAALIHLTGADLAISDLCFDPVSRTFPLRNAFWTDRIFHDFARNAVSTFGVGALVLALAGRKRTSPGVHEVALMVALSLAASTVTVAVVKAAVHRNCPWSYVRYGGEMPDGDPGAPLISFGDHEPAFPAGHAAGGFSLLVLYFAGRRRSPAAGRAGLAIGLAAGTALGVTQVLRGAHFLSHNLWTAGICWYVACAVDAVVPQRQSSSGA